MERQEFASIWCPRQHPLPPSPPSGNFQSDGRLQISLASTPISHVYPWSSRAFNVPIEPIEPVTQASSLVPDINKDDGGIASPSLSNLTRPPKATVVAGNNKKYAPVASSGPPFSTKRANDRKAANASHEVELNGSQRRVLRPLRTSHTRMVRWLAEVNFQHMVLEFRDLLGT